MDKKVIYIVDDDVEIRDLLCDVLKVENFEVTAIPNGIKLFDELKKKKPDLILLDIMMSWIDGLDICESMKKNQLYKNIPIIFITAYKNEKMEQQIKNTPANDYIFKPFNLDDLLAKIKKYI